MSQHGDVHHAPSSSDFGDKNAAVHLEIGEVDEAAGGVLGSTLFHVTLEVTEILVGSCRSSDFPSCKQNQEQNLNTTFHCIFSPQKQLICDPL